jgi:hypothetical protein
VKIVCHAVLTPVRFALLSWALIVPACFSLPKADVSTHVIDDFAEDAGADAGLIPTWGAFTLWTCDAFTIRDQNSGDASADGGAVLDAGQPPGLDGGPPVACTLGPGDAKAHGLAATFDLATSADNLGVAVATHTMLGPVDFTGFKTFQFDAKLGPTRPTAGLPVGTQLEVELACTTNTTEAIAIQIANITVGAPTWNLIPLPLADFQVTPSSQSRTTCLGAVERIRFIVLLPSAAGPSTGTLQLDNIELTTN